MQAKTELVHPTPVRSSFSCIISKTFGICVSLNSQGYSFSR